MQSTTNRILINTGWGLDCLKDAPAGTALLTEPAAPPVLQPERKEEKEYAARHDRGCTDGV